MAKTVNNDLFAAADRALARRQDPQTSHDAAASLDEALPALEALVLAAIKTHRAAAHSASHACAAASSRAIACFNIFAEKSASRL